MRCPRRYGFTLIELLVVIAILGLVATITAVAIGGARMKSRDNKRVADLKQIQKAIELSYSATTGYPVVAGPIVLGAVATDVLCAKGSVAGFKPDSIATNCDADKIYMGLVPSNPMPGGANYTYESTNGAGATCTSGVCSGYCVQV